jgi:glycosyltransferase involved in cell wall biosynthesis
MRPSFSVIIAAYQAADTIAETIESALEQTVPAQEVMVCDDGSTDDLLRVIEPYRDQIVLLRQPNRGFAAARNTLLWNATGDFAVFLDADDAFLPRRLEALTELASADPGLDVVSTDAYVQHGGRIVGRNSDGNVFPATGQLEAMTRRCYLVSPAIRTGVLRAIGGFDESLRIAADWDCWLRVLLHGARAAQVDEPLMYYRITDGSLSDNRARSLRERALLLERAARSPEMPPPLRARLEPELAGHRLRALQAEADRALARGGQGARRAQLRVARAPRASPRERLAAAANALAPGRARAAARARLVRPRP